MKPLYLIELESVSIFEQLQIEEALLRTESRSFCLINRNAPRAIVMGISGILEELVDTAWVEKEKVPIIQRFSGGGTVIVDPNTLFISFLFANGDVPIAPFPEPILRWSEELYQSAWKIPEFRLCENDYLIGNRKCGGNAQYIRKQRWLHHTSFLFDYDPKNMDSLLLPKKRPAYRESRSHIDFLCRMKEYVTRPEELIASLKEELSKRFYLSSCSFTASQAPPHRKGTRILSTHAMTATHCRQECRTIL